MIWIFCAVGFVGWAVLGKQKRKSMIKAVPTSKEYYESGRELINLAWDIGASLLIELDEAEECGIDLNDDDDLGNNFLKLQKRKIASAISTLQQGVELIIKGRIAEVSPFILISDAPTKYPSPYNGEINFEDIRCIDAQDLIKVHDLFCTRMFNEEFKNKFNELRTKRNKIMHTTCSSISFELMEIFKSILFVNSYLFDGVKWQMERHVYTKNAPTFKIFSNEYLTNYVCRELSIIIDKLDPADVLNYYGIHKKNRAYFCQECYENATKDIDFTYKLARLVSKDLNEKRIYCPVCCKEGDVERIKCTNCDGNVISASDYMCLSCASYEEKK